MLPSKVRIIDFANYIAGNHALTLDDIVRKYREVVSGEDTLYIFVVNIPPIHTPASLFIRDTIMRNCLKLSDNIDNLYTHKHFYYQVGPGSTEGDDLICIWLCSLFNKIYMKVKGSPPALPCDYSEAFGRPAFGRPSKECAVRCLTKDRFGKEVINLLVPKTHVNLHKTQFDLYNTVVIEKGQVDGTLLDIPTQHKDAGDSNICAGTRCKIPRGLTLVRPTYSYLYEQDKQNLTTLIETWADEQFGDPATDFFENFIGELLSTKMFKTHLDPRDNDVIEKTPEDDELNWIHRRDRAGGTTYLQNTLRDFKDALPMINELEEKLSELPPALNVWLKWVLGKPCDAVAGKYASLDALRTAFRRNPECLANDLKGRPGMPGIATRRKINEALEGLETRYGSSTTSATNDGVVNLVSSDSDDERVR